MHLTLQYLAAVFFTLAFAISAGVSLIEGAVHSCTLPTCWYCGCGQVRRSAIHYLTDTTALILFLVPYRCRSCRRRFYGFRTIRVSGGGSDLSSQSKSVAYVASAGFTNWDARGGSGGVLDTTGAWIRPWPHKLARIGGPQDLDSRKKR
jgi:hypothetical protein